MNIGEPPRVYAAWNLVEFTRFLRARTSGEQAHGGGNGVNALSALGGTFTIVRRRRQQGWDVTGFPGESLSGPARGAAAVGCW